MNKKKTVPDSLFDKEEKKITQHRTKKHLLHFITEKEWDELIKHELRNIGRRDNNEE